LCSRLGWIPRRARTQVITSTYVRLQGETGPPGYSSPVGLLGSIGRLRPKGCQGLDGVRGLVCPRLPPSGVSGATGSMQSWAAAQYFYPSAANTWTRLMEFYLASCQLKTKYNGVWGAVCATCFIEAYWHLTGTGSWGNESSKSKHFCSAESIDIFTIRVFACQHTNNTKLSRN
jgi:hypothetical protein